MSDSNIELLEAEGQLNQQIQSALRNFREKLLEKASPTDRQHVKKPNEQKEGPEKRFKFRESLLSIMFQIKDFRTLYNMVVASFIILTCSLFYDSYINKGQLLDMMGMFSFFSGVQTIVLAWISLSINFFCIIFVMKLGLKVSRYIWIPLYIAHVTLTINIATYFVASEGLGFASVIIIMAEAVRMIMKAHSYIRTKLLYLKDSLYRDFQFRGITVVNSKGTEDDNKDKIFKIKIQDGDLFMEIKKLSYFFWAPTLIYRDSYILTPVRSFKNIIVHMINFLACVYYAFMLYQTWFKHSIEALQKKIDFVTLSSTVMNLMLPSVLLLIMGFFGFLHSWLNLWAQITRFPDRAFYSDWWNSVQFGSYYRRWNIVVHDWLYYYMYLDIYRFFFALRKSRTGVQLITFIISAIIHEWIIYYAIGFFYPILFLLFAGPGLLFMQMASIRRNSVNLIFWLQMYLGTALMFALYLVEVFARQKVADEKIVEIWGAVSFLIPRTFYLGAF